MNYVPIWAYTSIQDGIDATVLTLLLPQYYSVIRDHLRQSVPRAQWGDACGDLGVWGTGCNWLQQTYGGMPITLLGENDMTPDEHYALVDVQNQMINKVLPSVKNIEGQMTELKAQIAKIPAADFTQLKADVATLLIVLGKIETALKSA